MAVGLIQVTLSAAERTAALASGRYRVSGKFVANTVPLIGGFWVFKATVAAGTFGLYYDATNGKLDLYVRGIVEMSTALLTTDPVGGTFQNWIYGDTVDWSIWFDVAGGARSMGIRWGVNGCFGADTVGVGSGAALGAITAAVALGSNSTSWSATTRATGVTTADVDATGLIIGDSTSACYRSADTGTGSRIGQVGIGTVAGTIATIAQTGATAVQQLASYNASKYKTQTGMAWCACMIGINDLNGGATAATTLGRIQAIYDTWIADHPGLPFQVLYMTPGRYLQTAAQYQAKLDVHTGISGGGATPITGAFTRPVTSHYALMGDANGSLLYRSASTDATHATSRGRAFIGSAIYADLVAAGITP